MNGLMMDTPLLISSIMNHAERNHPNQEIVSLVANEGKHRYTYGEAFARSRKLANALAKLGLNDGDRVATLAWNDYRHFELYYAISSSGYVCHTINPRLFPEQLVYIINHAEDRWLFVDPAFIPMLEGISDQVSLEGIVVLCKPENMPETSLPNVHCYETFIADESETYEWPNLDENAASALCYTSGTTGNPKGVMYSHRSTLLHAYASALADSLGVCRADSVLPVVPMFHVNAWGVVYSSPMVGAKLVFPGPSMGDGEALHGLIDSESVTIAMGVPTVWLALLNYLESSGKHVETLSRTVVGGSACPLSIIKAFDEKYDVYTHCAWGMTEMSPLGTANVPTPAQRALPEAELDKLRVKAGRAVFGVDMRIIDDNGNELPWDGVQFGALQVRGPWICSDYFKLDKVSDAHEDGWFNTGDVATIDSDGNMQITDRIKDVIKSGGEWISSIDLENTAVGHPAVAEAAVIGVSHPKWTERPLLVVVKHEGEALSKEEMLAWFDGKVAKWWIPTDVEFVAELPHTATGKLQKMTLREQFKDYELSD